MSNDSDRTTLGIAYWVNTHTELLQRIAYGIAFFLVGILWVNVIIRAIPIALNFNATRATHQSIGQVRLDPTGISRPVTLQLEGEGLVANGSGGYDAFAIVTNSNPKHAISFTYTFTGGGKEMSQSDILAAPNSTSYLVARSFAAENIGTPDVQLTNIDFEQVPENQVGTEVVFDEVVLRPISTEVATTVEETTTDLTGASETLNESEDDSFITPETPEDETSEASVETLFTGLFATATNTSVLGFRELPVVAVLRDGGGNIVGVHKITYTGIESFDEITVQLVWRKRFSIDTTAELAAYPQFLDRDNLIYPGEEQ